MNNARNAIILLGDYLKHGLEEIIKMADRLNCSTKFGRTVLLNITIVSTNNNSFPQYSQCYVMNVSINEKGGNDRQYRWNIMWYPRAVAIAANVDAAATKFRLHRTDNFIYRISGALIMHNKRSAVNCAANLRMQCFTNFNSRHIWVLIKKIYIRKIVDITWQISAKLAAGSNTHN